jgi:protein phosphatase
MFWKKKENKQESNRQDESSDYANESSIFDIQYCTRTDEGMVRKKNEDSICFIKPNESKQLFEKGTLAIVADGMGGHAGGEVASRIAVETISNKYFGSNNKSIPDTLNQAILDANARILKTAKKDHTLKGMGTTATSLVIKGNQAYYAHIGDSRLYHYRNSSLNLISSDHTLVQKMVDSGNLSLYEADGHSQKNVLLQALGTKPKIDIQSGQLPVELKPGDRFLLCSDGLTDLIKDIEIKQIMEMSSIYMIAICLIALAKDRGGHDNISVILLHVALSGSRDNQRITRDIT